MSSQEFQAAYNSIKDTGYRLLQYLTEFREGAAFREMKVKGYKALKMKLTKL